MSTPDDDRHCPRCFAPLRRSESPEGLCPKCLLAVGLGEDAVIRTQTGAPVPAPPSLAELRPHFDGLDILSLIGRGGAGAVYRATQRDLGRQVALKVLLLDPEVDPAFGERFVREARAMASLTHPNIAAVHDAGRAGPYWYLVMEFVDGPNLRQLIQSRDLAAGEALDVVRQICDALEYAHGEGVVHRDIKPENVLVDARGRVKLVDFGLAKLLGAAPGMAPGGATLTRSSQAMGTWHYMAPEQLRRPLEVDHRADIYSLGVVLYELLTGEVPQGRYAPVSERSRADRRVDAIVDRALEQDPARRYQQASGVRDDVTRVQSEPVAEPTERRGGEATAASGRAPAAHDEARGEQAPAPKARNPFAVGCLVVMLILFFVMLLSALMLTMWAAPSPSPTRTGAVSTSELSPGPAKLMATVQSLYPAIDVTDAALGAWSRYRRAEKKHTELAAFQHGERVWAQVDILPFPEERERLIDAMLRELEPADRFGRHGALRTKIDERGLLPSGARARTFEIERTGKNRVNIHLDGEPLQQAVPILPSADPVLRPVMLQLRTGEALKRILAEAVELPWSKEQLGVRSAPADVYRALATWWSAHLALERQHTSSRVTADPAAMVFEVAPFVGSIEAGRKELRARELEREAYVGSARSVRAAGGGLGLDNWPLGNAPTPRSCSVMATIGAFPVERAALETRLLTRLAELPIRIDSSRTDRVVRALLPFGERNTSLVDDRVGDVRALIALDTESREASLAWIGRAADWRVERLLRRSVEPILSNGERGPGPGCHSPSSTARRTA